MHRPTLISCDVSVVVVSFNTRDMLRECIHSVYRAAGSLRLQLIVVDNASTDGSAAMVVREFPDATIVQSKVNLGFGPANNLGFQSVQGRYTILLNSDAFLTPEILELSVAHMEAHPETGVGGGRLVGSDGTLQPSARMFPTVLNDLIVLSGMAARFPSSRFFGRFDRTWADALEPAEVDWVPGAYSIIRTGALRDVGYFDPRFFLYYEEVDLCRRMKQQGYSVRYWPDLVIVHIGGESSRSVPSLQMSRAGAQLTLWRMRSMLLYYRKHHGLSARLAMLTELLWHWLQSQRRILSRDPERRARALDDRLLVSTMGRAWRDTRGGRLSPAQPW